MRETEKELIKSLDLFYGCDKTTIEKIIIDLGYAKSFRSGDIIIADDPTPYVAILLSGKCAIYTAHPERKALLRFVSPSEAIGVASIFAKSPPDTKAIACGDGRISVFFVSRKQVELLLESPTGNIFRDNLLNFLCDRVSFLNSKINVVTSGNAEHKLVMYIRSLNAAENEPIDIGMSYTSLAYALDIGRASLYRAFDRLIQDGAIVKASKSIKIISYQKLEKY